jgi:hypothetical protein
MLNEILSLDERGEKYSVLFNTMRPHIYIKVQADNSISLDEVISYQNQKRLNEGANCMLLP